MAIDMERTRKYYEELEEGCVCKCSACQNYVKRVDCEYPELVEALQKLGVDAAQPFNITSLWDHEDGYIEYIGVDYIVAGESADFFTRMAGSFVIYDENFYPNPTERTIEKIGEPYFMIGVYRRREPFRMKWIMRDDD